MDPFPSPVGGASLLLSFRMQRKTVLVIGGDSLAASRAYASLEADADVVVLIKGGLQAVCEELRWRAHQRQVTILDWNHILPDTHQHELEDDAVEYDIERDIIALDTYLTSTPTISLVCLTGTLSTAISSPSSTTSPFNGRKIAPHIAHVCQAHRIPVNIADMPNLCDFFFTASHRFVDPSTGVKSPMQLGVTANGQGCRLAGRIRREAVHALPREVGSAVVRIGQLRRLANEHHADVANEDVSVDVEVEEGDAEGTSISSPNMPVPVRHVDVVESDIEAVRRRMRWVAQVSEYWPIPRLAALTDSDMRAMLSGNIGLPSVMQAPEEILPSVHGLQLTSSTPPLKTKGRILLVGSGPGHPSLLTLATHATLTKFADLVLSDKLVPSAVLELIPKHVELRIARKFPGNADGAQSEMMQLAVESARRGLTVVRLKQGDPVVYGRAGEEVLYFRSQGFEPVVVPGVSSALAGPTFAGIPVTQRGVAETFVVCTGVGRQGKDVQLPGYERSRTLLMLMGVARITEIVGALLGYPPAPQGSGREGTATSTSIVRQGRRDGCPYPRHTPIAIIERASMSDQRVLVSTLGDVCAGLDSLDSQRPPGMMVVGWAVLALAGDGDVRVLEEGEDCDEERVRRWLMGRRWNVWEGIPEGWAGFGVSSLPT